jgi:hypothetical protein
MDIFRDEYKDGTYLKPEKLPTHISGVETGTRYSWNKIAEG